MTTVDEKSWHTLSLEEQFGNIGSEVSRALNATRMNNQERRDGALSRMIDLFHASKSDKRWYHQGAIVEFCRAQEATCDYFYGGNSYETTPESLMKYFDDFAKVTRK